jgi:hypothetical protein
MTFAIVMLFTALLLAFAQTAWALFHVDEHGNVVGLHIGGLPFDLVLGVAMLSASYFLTDMRQDLAQAIGLGALGCYACTWGKACAFVLAKWRTDTADADAE